MTSEILTDLLKSLGLLSVALLLGMLLLRICDPNLKSPAMASYSLSYTIMSVTYFVLLNMFITIPTTIGVSVTTIISIGITLTCVIGALVSSRICFGEISD